MMGTPYETDIVAWAGEQAALLRAGMLTAIDAANIAEEIEDVGRSQQHALGSHLTVLLAHLLKWHFQPGFRSHSWENTIREQRRAVARQLRKAPSLQHLFDDEEWLESVWCAAIDAASNETGLDIKDGQLWPVEQVLDLAFLPD
jgi:hypothetical protein